VSSSDYYPFGFEMGERSWSSDAYKYGFNGKEKDPEGMGGGGSTYDYGFRIYNPSIAKFLSVDPLTKEYPWYTPYQFAGNKPIIAIDLDGLEEKIVIRCQENGFEPIIYLQSDYTVDEWHSLVYSMMGMVNISENFIGENDFNKNSQADENGNITTYPETGTLTIYKNDAGYHSSYDETEVGLADPKPNPPAVEPRNPYLDNPKEFDFTESWAIFSESYEGRRFVRSVSIYSSLVTLPVSLSVSSSMGAINIINVVSTLDDAAGGLENESFTDAHIDNDAIKLTINSIKLAGGLASGWKSVMSLEKTVSNLSQTMERVNHVWNLSTLPVTTAFEIRDLKNTTEIINNDLDASDSDESSESNSENTIDEN
jgi:RHS repeat-associated protein